jgi:hypothetical protein
MKETIIKNKLIKSNLLPVDIVLHPSWWYKNADLTFDRDFFHHPLKRVESERKMEKILYERFGEFGLGEDREKNLPVIGAVHNAAGYMISEMLGCKVNYLEDAAPQVIPAEVESLLVDINAAFKNDCFKSLEILFAQLKQKYGYLSGDINWSGILNIALDLRGSNIFMDFLEKPAEVKTFFDQIAQVIEKFVNYIAAETNTTSISVNRNVRHIKNPVFLHSECSHTMISVEQYEEFLLPIDLEWSRKYRPFGIHYCGSDPHRYAHAFSKITNLDFLDVGWGGDLRELRKFLPSTFLNIRLSPVEILQTSNEELAGIIRSLVKDSNNPFLTGICCINMDDQVEDQKIKTIFRTVKEIREELVNQNPNYTFF